MKQNAAFFQKKEAVGDSSKAIAQRCRAARKSGFLNLSSNNIRELADSVFGEPQLDPDEKYWECEPIHKIDLSFNQLASIPPGIGQMGLDLVTLIIRSNELTSLPMELFECSKLRVLDVSSNKLTELGDGFNKLVDLRELQLHDNQLRFLPESLQYCANLASLNVGDNRLEALPDFVCCGRQLSRFKVINASNNCISSLCSSIRCGELVISMPFLESFDMQRNQLGTATLVFYDCPAVSYVNLSENKLSACPVFADCPKLSRLHLSNNRICSFDFPRTQQQFGRGDGLFGPSSCLSESLVELHVNNNSLSAIPDGIVHCLALKVLDISNNNIGDLNCCLGFVKSLQRIAVEGNPIRTIRRTVLTESTVNLKTYLRSRYADSEQLLRFETVQNMQEDPAVQRSLLTESVGGGGADGAENLVVVQRARDATGGVLDLSGLQLQAFPQYIIPSLYRCDAITSANAGLGNVRGSANTQVQASVGRRYAANTQKQGLHGFGSDVADYNSSIIEEAKVLCVTDVNLSRNCFSQLPYELHGLSGGGQQGSLGSYDGDSSRGITALNLSHNKLGAAASGSRGQISSRSALAPGLLPPCLEQLDVSNNGLVDADLHVVLSACMAGAGGQVAPLRVLLCSNNRLQSFLPNFALSAVARLREVQMAHNTLTSLEQVSFRVMRCLEIVNFSDNRLVSVGRLWEATQLRTVVLDNNNLQSIPPELAFLSNLSSLSIHGNPQKGVRFDVLQRGTEAVLQALRNKLSDQQTAVHNLSEVQGDMRQRVQTLAQTHGCSAGDVYESSEDSRYRSQLQYCERSSFDSGPYGQQQSGLGVSERPGQHVFTQAPVRPLDSRMQLGGYGGDSVEAPRPHCERSGPSGSNSQSLATYQQNRSVPATARAQMQSQTQAPILSSGKEVEQLQAEILVLTDRLECSSLSTMKTNELKRELAKKRANLMRLSS